MPLHPPFTFTDAARSRPQEAPNTWRRIRERGELVVSMDPANLPYSGAREDRPGFEVELARALARQLDVRLRIEWLDVQHQTAVGELLEHACDLVLGAVVEPNAVADDEPLAGKIAYSRPYCGTGNVLVHRKNGPPITALSALRGAAAHAHRDRGRLDRRLSPAPAGFPAPPLPQPARHVEGTRRRRHRSRLLVGERGLDPPRLSRPGRRLELVPGYMPEDHWNIAIAMSPGDDELKRHVDAALAPSSAMAPSLLPWPATIFPPSRLSPSLALRVIARATEVVRAAPLIRSGMRSPSAAASLRCSASRGPGILIPGWPESARPVRWSSVSTRITSPFRPPTPSPPGSTTRSPVCSPRSLALHFASTGASPRTIPTPPTWRPNGAAT